VAFLVLAYPNIQSSDFALIQEFRKGNDELFYSVVEPHFTIVFPAFDLTKEEFCQAIFDTTIGVEKIDFTIRCATINKDAFNEYYHSFLVPDEGYSKIIKLHDKLYNGHLKGNLRLDIGFVPHIGVGNSKDKFECKKMVDSWNKKDFSIKGKITKLTIVEYENNKVTKLQDIELR
jgi:2'-5' RNA ligase superfamily protein